MTQRPNHVEDRVACFQLAEKGSRLAHRLDDDGDGAGCRVRAFDGERNALALFMKAKNDELAGALFARNTRRLNHELLDVEANRTGFDDSVHEVRSPMGTELWRPLSLGRWDQESPATPAPGGRTVEPVRSGWTN
jgi:hypothetical protein